MEKLIEKIETDDSNVECVLRWLSEDKYNGLAEFQTHAIIRYLLKEVQSLKLKIKENGNIQRVSD